MIKIRKAEDRGYNKIDWLESWHTFSFSDYHDSEHMGFGDLRVINEDIIQPASGFDTHGHRDMEIVTYVMAGELFHKDSTGEEGVIRHGEIQRMTAGRGILHSEHNRSDNKTAHLFQIWILPEAKNLKPGYEQKRFPYEEGKLQLICSPDKKAGSLKIHQDVNIYRAQLDKGKSVTYDVDEGRQTWLQMADGNVIVNDEILHSKDAAAISNEGLIKIIANDRTEFLLFDMR